MRATALRQFQHPHVTEPEAAPPEAAGESAAAPGAAESPDPQATAAGEPPAPTPEAKPESPAAAASPGENPAGEQGEKEAVWTWDDGKLVVASADGVTDEFQLRQGKP